MPATIARWSSQLLPVVAAIFLAFYGVPAASAATITYTSFSLTAGDNISISAPTSVVGRAGQIRLQGVTGLGAGQSTLIAWCLDIYDSLRSGTNSYNIVNGPLPQDSAHHTNNPGQFFNRIGGLMLQGNNYLAQAVSTFTFTLGGQATSVNRNDLAAATQVAIWRAEYSGFAYTITSSLSTTRFNQLVALLESTALANVAYQVLNPSPTCWQGYHCNQTLGTVTAVPLPLAGAGLPGLVFVAGGLLAWRRRQKLRAPADSGAVAA